MPFILSIDNIDVDYAGHPGGLDYCRACNHWKWSVYVCQGSPYVRTGRYEIARVDVTGASWQGRDEACLKVRESLTHFADTGYFETLKPGLLIKL